MIIYLPSALYLFYFIYYIAFITRSLQRKFVYNKTKDVKDQEFKSSWSVVGLLVT